MMLFERRVSGSGIAKSSIREDWLVSSTDLHTPINRGIVSAGLGRDFRQANSGQAGRSFPLGATVFAEGVNFSVFSRHASRVELLLFDDAAEAHPTARDRPRRAQDTALITTGTFSSPVSVPGRSMLIGPVGLCPEHGLRFDPTRFC